MDSPHARVAVLLTVLAMVASTPEPTEGCGTCYPSCVELQVARSDFVFLGYVRGIVVCGGPSAPGSCLVAVEVIEAWKGNIRGTVLIKTEMLTLPPRDIGEPVLFLASGAPPVTFQVPVCFGAVAGWQRLAWTRRLDANRDCAPFWRVEDYAYCDVQH